MSKKKKPSRIFRSRRSAPTPPPEIEKLRQARSVVDPAQAYEIEMPDGSIYRCTGAEMLATADAMVALADASKAGDEEAMQEAILKFLSS